MTASAEPSITPFPRLHLVTDEAIIRGEGFAGRAAELIGSYGGRIALHLRGRTLSGRELFDAGMACASVARDAGTLLVINDRVDVALCCKAPAIQLPGRSLSVRDARRLMGDATAIGASVHSVEEAAHAVDEGADFLLAGTVFSTRSHPGVVGAGTDWLTGLAALGRPVVAIGGITADRAIEVIRAGAHGVAVMRAVWSAADPIAAVATLLDAVGGV